MCWDDHDLVNGRPTGAIRASLGYMSSWEDTQCLVDFLREHFLDYFGAPGERVLGRGGVQGLGEGGDGRLLNGAARNRDIVTARATAVVHSGRAAGRIEGGKGAFAKGGTSIAVDTSAPASAAVADLSIGGAVAAAAAGGGHRVPETLPITPSECMAKSAVDTCKGKEPALAPAGCSETETAAAAAGAPEANSKDAAAADAAGAAATPTAAADAVALGQAARGAGHRDQGDSAQVAKRTRAAAAPPPPPPPPPLLSPSVLAAGRGRPANAAAAVSDPGRSSRGVLSAILLYPIKSCAAQVVTSWPCGPTGLLYDREWALVDDAGQVVTLKKCPLVTQVTPSVDLVPGVLTVTSPRVQQPLRLKIPGALGEGHTWSEGEGQQALVSPRGALGVTPAGATSVQQEVKVCGDTVCGSVLADVLLPEAPAAPIFYNSSSSSINDGDVYCCNGMGGSASVTSSSTVAGALQAVALWFEAAIGVRCKVVQQVPQARKVKREGGKGQDAGVTAVAAAFSAGSQAAMQASAVGPPPGVLGADKAARVEGAGRVAGGGGEQYLGFANEGQYLLVNLESVKQVMALQGGGGTHVKEQTSAAAAAAGAAAVKMTGAAAGKKAAAAAAGMKAAAGGPGTTAAAGAAVEAAGASSVSRSGTAAVILAKAAAGRPEGTRLASAAETYVGSDVLRFRPNFVVSGMEAWEEDNWEAVSIGGSARLVVVGACARCDAITVDPITGSREGSGLLRVLAQHRREKGKLKFGVLLGNGEGWMVQCGGPGCTAGGNVVREGGFNRRLHNWVEVGDVVMGH